MIPPADLVDSAVHFTVGHELRPGREPGEVNWQVEEADDPLGISK